ncbi:hypothetical protein EVAR_99191_1 [Eumeta japonica]|uniref:Uncharacterized protein n=1 Tax=Eumeta variegata TaxID=151549 RepID=A0A4C1YUU2_EUMVA|nr:hypothetical protein EVAR_99191_1 [Eumeta japonica]
MKQSRNRKIVVCGSLRFLPISSGVQLGLTKPTPKKVSARLGTFTYCCTDLWRAGHQQHQRSPFPQRKSAGSRTAPRAGSGGLPVIPIS